MKVRGETKHYLYIAIASLFMGLGAMAIFQNCAIHRSGSSGSSSHGGNFSDDIEMRVGNKTYHDDILKPSNVVFTVSDPQASDNLEWYIDYIDSKGVVTNVLREPVSGGELTHSFDSRKLGKYTVVAIEDLGDDRFSYQKNITLVSSIEADLGYRCPVAGINAFVPDTVPTVANCHTGEAAYVISVRLNNPFSSSCIIRATSGSNTQTLEKIHCNTQNSVLNVNVPNTPTNNRCKTVQFNVKASNVESNYTVYYKIDSTGFKLSTDSSWCGTTTTQNPGGGETCYVLSQSCYTPLNSDIYLACGSRIREVDVSASCSDEYSRCTVYDCQSAR